jgi:hypothetical protein
MDKLEKLIAKYVEAAKRHGEATDCGDNKTANKQYKVIEKCYSELMAHGEVGIRELIPLLDDPNNFVRLWAASHLLHVEPTRAKQILANLSGIKGSLVGFNADMVLKEWEKGDLKF